MRERVPVHGNCPPPDGAAHKVPQQAPVRVACRAALAPGVLELEPATSGNWVTAQEAGGRAIVERPLHKGVVEVHKTALAKARAFRVWVVVVVREEDLFCRARYGVGVGFGVLVALGVLVMLDVLVGLVEGRDVDLVAANIPSITQKGIDADDAEGLVGVIMRDDVALAHDPVVA